MKKFKNMGGLIKESRHLREKTQLELANEIGKTRSFICQIEMGGFQLPIRYHLQVAKYLQIEPIDVQAAYINDCMDNYQRSLEC